MFRRIFNQWPRILLVALLLTISLFAISGINPFAIYSDELSFLRKMLMLLTEGAVLFVVALCASLLAVTLVAVLLPGFLGLLEFMAFALMLFALLRPVLHDLGAPRPLANLAIIALGMLCNELLNGRLSRFLPRVSFGPRSASFHTRLTPEEVWPRIVPDPATIGLYYQPGAMVMPAPEGSDAAFTLCIPRRFGYPDTACLVRFPLREAPHHVVTRSSTVHNQDKCLIETLDCTITPTDTGSRVTLTIAFENIGPGTWLQMTLSSIQRDLAMCLRARLDGRRDHSLLGREIRKR
ncbi:MAG: hypothetical protein AB7U46_07035, partial [Paenirhodobacter sp.]|uniref:hypothetical protein n=1 Tax=Paenirhodobacter sp. TaxID=1965326 RepID=UPI003D1258B2